MKLQVQILKLVFIFICVLAFDKLVESTPSTGQNSGSKSENTQETPSRAAPLSTSSIHHTNDLTTPPIIRNRRSNSIVDKEQLVDDGAALDSAFLYNDEIMRNLFKTQTSKPLNYARSNFFLNLLKPRITRYNAWDDHSLMHFGKRSISNEDNKVPIKRSVESWLQNSPSYMNEQPAGSTNEEITSPFLNSEVSEIPNFETDLFYDLGGLNSVDSTAANSINSEENKVKLDGDLRKKSGDPWHSMMSFGKKSQNPWDHNTLHFGKRDDSWKNKMDFDKRFDNSWDHNTMHFGKKDDPWHSMMSFGKRYENDWDYNTLHFGKRDPWDHSTLHFGKRDPWEHDTLHFGKRDPWEHDTLHFGKRDPWEHDTLHFGKKDDPWHNMMSFGKKADPWHSMMSFGKRSDKIWDHNTLHFDKKDNQWHNILTPENIFGDIYSNKSYLDKRDDPWHNMMSFGKKSANPWDHNTLHFGKKDEPWHSVMSFGKKSSNENAELQNTKRDELWHSTMSFGKKADFGFDHNTLHFGKRDEPWHSMMSFGKKSSIPWDHSTLHFGKKNEPWHSMMSFGKKSYIPWDHSTLHFGKKNEPWHSMMSFGKRSNVPADGIVDDFVRNSNAWEESNGMILSKKLDPWDHDTLHFGKKSNASSDSDLSLQNKGSTISNRIKKRSIDTWDDHHTMHFGKKSESEENLNKMPFGKQFNFDDFENSFDVHKKSDWNSHNTMHFGKKSDPWSYHDTMHFGKRSPWDNYNTMHFGKRNPWESHNTMHFGKRNPWESHNTMHFGKRNPWESHNTMHFGKRNPWESHNTMHFGKRNPWESHNTMHFGKRSDTQHNEMNSVFDKDIHNQANQNLKSKDISKPAEKEISEKNYSLLKEGDLKSIYEKNALENDELTGDPSKNLNTGQKVMIQNRIIKRSLKNNENPRKGDSILVKNNIKTPGGFSSVFEEKHIGPLGITNTTPKVENNEKSKTYATSSKLNSRIEKRSLDSEKIGSFKAEIALGLNPETPLNNDNIKDDFPENVLHFGKRSVDTSDADEFQLSKDEDEKRYDDYWNSHNTLHFGKKFDPWEDHSTLHFGKRNPWEDHSTLHFGKRNPWESHSTMHFGKRDPWESHNTLHFGKKFDPWESHTKMHFGKKSNSWDQNVMHFGKKDKIYPDEQNIEDREDILSLLLDPSALEAVIQTNLAVEISDEQKREILEKLDNLKNLVNFHLDDENMDFQEKLEFLKSYLKPILRTIISREIIDDAFSNPFSSLEEYSDEDGNINIMNDDNRNNPDLEEPYRIPIRSIPSNTNLEDAFPNESEDNAGELIDDYKFNENKDIINQKRSYLGKPELKRYFIPFQGPKSIVYPHAWFASQIRRSSLPRTREYSRNLELRMAEKKEDPFNSYMHFGRR